MEINLSEIVDSSITSAMHLCFEKSALSKACNGMGSVFCVHAAIYACLWIKMSFCVHDPLKLVGELRFACLYIFHLSFA